MKVQYFLFLLLLLGVLPTMPTGSVSSDEELYEEAEIAQINDHRIEESPSIHRTFQSPGDVEKNKAIHQDSNYHLCDLQEGHCESP
jgi:hypothetical protein